MKGSVTEAERDGGKSRGDGVGTCNVKGKERETAREKARRKSRRGVVAICIL